MVCIRNYALNMINTVSLDLLSVNSFHTNPMFSNENEMLVFGHKKIEFIIYQIYASEVKKRQLWSQL